MPETSFKSADRAVIRPLWWNDTLEPRGALEMIDQTRLPGELVHIVCRDSRDVWHAIKTLQVRGAPAIGVAAAYGVIVGLDAEQTNDENWRRQLDSTADYLATSRPTAVNLFWALDRMRRRADALGSSPWIHARAALLAEAHAIRDEDAAMCRAIGAAGRHLIPDGGGVLTHCNAGALATSEYGTALAVMYRAQEDGRRFRVFVDETRPLLQGSRLTAWELIRAGIDTTLICDNSAAVVMREKKVDLVIVGADRVAANGDAANKIGTYGVAVLAKAHGIPFYVAAPSSTFDFTIPDGTQIPIEYREPNEIRCLAGVSVAPPEVDCFSPAFDVTPASLISGIVTEHGVIAPVTSHQISALLLDS
ncbi:MAG TPA: S-methyl-5-thioribose-1-phosphate isomerase [Phycisphaerae bacterium]|nr:S-methyl-5-thioribose-1-phosphate isomerase [Phycisphaerae bacterium]